MGPFALIVIGLVMVYGTAALQRRARRRRDLSGVDLLGQTEMADSPADTPQTPSPPALTAVPDAVACRDRLLVAHRVGTVRNALLGLIGVVIAMFWFAGGGDAGAFGIMLIGGWVAMDAVGRVWTLHGFRVDSWRSAQATIWAATLDEDGDVDEDFDGFIGCVHLILKRDVDDPDDVAGTPRRETRPCLVRFVPRTAMSATSWNGLTVVLIESADGQVIGDVAGRRLYHADSSTGWQRLLVTDPGDRR